LTEVWLTVAQAAEAVQVSQKTIRRAIARGDLPAHNVQGTVRIIPGDFEDWRRGSPIQPRQRSHITSFNRRSEPLPTGTVRGRLAAIRGGRDGG
jgi:excisionase family DNA binding protein